MKALLGWLWFWLVAAVAAYAIRHHSGPVKFEAPPIPGKVIPQEKIEPCRPTVVGTASRPP